MKTNCLVKILLSNLVTYSVEMYIENTEGFEGEGDLLSKFGVEVRDQATFVLSRRTWNRFVSLDQNLVTSTRPQEGDLIYFPLGNQIFEIRFVEHENPFYQLGKLNVFKLQCETFEYSHESFDTGIAELDGVEDSFAYQVYYDIRFWFWRLCSWRNSHTNSCIW